MKTLLHNTMYITLLLTALLLIGCGGGASTSESDSNTSTDNDNIVSSDSSSSGSVTLLWEAPTENTNGSFLTDLASYKIYYGTSPEKLAYSINIENPSLSTYIIDNLSSNTTYYFTITAFNNKGIESTYSNFVSQNIQP